MMHSHEFKLVVETNGTRKQAETAVLLAFASRQPDGCKFHLRRKNPNPKPRAK